MGLTPLFYGIAMIVLAAVGLASGVWMLVSYRRETNRLRRELSLTILRKWGKS